MKIQIYYQDSIKSILFNTGYGGSKGIFSSLNLHHEIAAFIVAPADRMSPNKPSTNKFNVTIKIDEPKSGGYLGQRSTNFLVRQIWSPLNFDISLKVGVPVLKEVKAQSKNYRFDSIENRNTYPKIFNYKRPTLGSIVTSFGLGFTITIY